MRIYCECKNVENFLLRRIRTVLDNAYIKHLVDYDTYFIEEDIQTILDSLFTNYGKVQSEEVKSKEAEVINLTFNTADHMVTLYIPIKKLQKLATTANIPY